MNSHCINWRHKSILQLYNLWIYRKWFKNYLYGNQKIFYGSTTPKLSNLFVLLGYADITFQSGSRIAFLFFMIQPFKDSFHCHLTIKSRTRNGLMCSKFLSLLYCITWKRYISNYDLRNFYSGTWSFCTSIVFLLWCQ